MKDTCTVMELNGKSKTSSHFALQWNGYESHLTGGMKVLLTDERLADVTLSCEGKYIRAHKLILSLCSPYFKTLFEVHSFDRGGTIVILNHVRIKDLENILCYAYTGQVQVHQSDLNSFLQTGELLQVEGLTSCAPGSTEQTICGTNTSNTNTETSRHGSSAGIAGRSDEASDTSASSIRNSRSRSSPLSPNVVNKKNEDDVDILITHTIGASGSQFMGTNATPDIHTRPSVTERNFEITRRSGVINYEQESEVFQSGILDNSGCDEEKEVNMSMLKDETIEVLEIHDYRDHIAGRSHQASELHTESQPNYLTDPIAVPSTSGDPVAGSSQQLDSTRNDSILTCPNVTTYARVASKRFRRNSINDASFCVLEKQNPLRGPFVGGCRVSSGTYNTVEDAKRTRCSDLALEMSNSSTLGISTPMFPLEARMYSSLKDLHSLDEEQRNAMFGSVLGAEKRVICPFCGRSFKNSASLKVHKSVKHRGMR